MSVTRARTVQMRRSEEMAVPAGVARRLDGADEGGGELAGWLDEEAGASVVKKRSGWVELLAGSGGDNRLLERGFALRARRLARVGGLSSLSDIPPESSIARCHRARRRASYRLGVSGGDDRRPREAG